MKSIKAKNPTRLVPDVPGFTCLSKNEMKFDHKSINKVNQTSMLVTTNEKNTKPASSSQIKRSGKPRCEPTSTVYSKCQRFMQWINDPDTIQKDVQHFQDEALAGKDLFERHLVDEELWNETFQFSRKILVDSIHQCHRSNMQQKLVTQQIYRHIEDDIHTQQSQQSSSGGNRKRKMRQMKDVLAELHEWDLLLEDKLRDYETLAEQWAEEVKADKNKKRSRNDHNNNTKKLPQAPVVCIQVESPISIKKPDQQEMKALGDVYPQRVSHFMKSKEQLSDAVFPFNEDLPEAMQSMPTTNNTNTNSTTLSPQQQPASTSKGPISSKPEPNLPTVFTIIEESVRASELTQAAADYLFSDTRVDLDRALLTSILPDMNPSSDVVKSIDDESLPFDAVTRAIYAQRDQVAPLLCLEDELQGWGRYLTGFLEAMQPQETIVTRRRKKDLENIQPFPASADVRLRPPRGVPLLLSPLSQYEDRALGTIDVDTIFTPMPSSSTSIAEKEELEYSINPATLLPKAVRQQEDIVLERCHLQSVAAIAQLQFRALFASSAELTRNLQDGEAQLAKRKAAYMQALKEDIEERQKMEQELQQYGLSSSNNLPQRSSKRVSTHSTTHKAIERSSSNGSVHNPVTINKRPSRNQAPVRAPLAPPAAAVTRNKAKQIDVDLMNNNNSSNNNATDSNTVEGDTANVNNMKSHGNRNNRVSSTNTSIGSSNGSKGESLLQFKDLTYTSNTVINNHNHNNNGSVDSVMTSNSTHSSRSDNNNNNNRSGTAVTSSILTPSILSGSNSGVIKRKAISK